MTYTFLKAQGHATGKSRCRGRQARRGPAPARTGRRQARPAASTTWSPTAPDGVGRDQGRRRARTSPTAGSAWTSARRPSPPTATIIKPAGTVVWNGPMGKFEDEPFRQGTSRRSPRRWPTRRGDGRRRRRDRRGRRAVRLRRQGDPCLDRRRRLPRVPRRKNVQLAEGHSRSLMKSIARGVGSRLTRPVDPTTACSRPQSQDAARR